MSQSHSRSLTASTVSNSLHCPDEDSATEETVTSRICNTWISDLQSPPPDESTVSALFDCEFLHMPSPDYLLRYRDGSIAVASRQDSINWMLRVHAFYNFKPVTALLAVNYFDRFLSANSLPQGTRWPFQLLSVACLSLAAKMEEPEPPLLLDLQSVGPRFLFEPKTIQRMELLVLSVLGWRLKSVTPFDFLQYFISKLPSSSNLDSHSEVFSLSSDLIIKVTRIVDFLRFPPSIIAAAAFLCAAGGSFYFSTVLDGRVNREMLRSCHQLMEEYLMDTCPFAAQLKGIRARPQVAPPPSPIGVLDAAACRSCDSRMEHPGFSSQAQADAEPFNKRPRSPAPDVQKP